MRIIGGIAKGKRIQIPKGSAVRPTSDNIKEALFNIICPIEGKTFVDLFAGSGSIGLEAISRGALRVVFVEKSLRLKETIKKNIYACGFEDKNYEIITNDVQAAIKLISQKKIKVDVLFADPPYEEGWIDSAIQYLGKGCMLSGGGLVILQHSYREILNKKLDHFQLSDQRRYGDTMLSFLSRKLPLREDAL